MNYQSGSETLCDVMKESVIKAFVGESKNLVENV